MRDVPVPNNRAAYRQINFLSVGGSAAGQVHRSGLVRLDRLTAPERSDTGRRPSKRGQRRRSVVRHPGRAGHGQSRCDGHWWRTCQLLQPTRYAAATCNAQKQYVNPSHSPRQLQYTISILFYDTIRYDTVYLTCSKKLTDSQLSLPHGMNKNCKRKNKINWWAW